MLDSYTNEPGVICYELMASVCYIRDKQAGGNLTAHILAGERYHKRKEGVTHKTWYLFNDFAITPIEKVIHVGCKKRAIVVLTKTLKVLDR